MKNGLIVLLAAAFLAGAFSSCAVKPKQVRPMEKVSLSEYPEFADDMAYDGLKHAILKSIAYFKRLPRDRAFVFDRDTYDSIHMIRSLRYFLNFIEKNPSREQLVAFVKKKYLVYRAAGDRETGRVLFTGYYEPLLNGKLRRDGKYRFPVHTPPSDIVTIDLSKFSQKFKGERIVGRVDGRRVVPYFNRREIEQNNALEGKARALAWVEDRVELFFLQIQGSGKIRLRDGSLLNVHYAGKNGRPYRSIGKLLIESGKIPKEKMSMQAIKHYLQKHPGEVNDILNANPSYVFFSLETEGPIGALNFKLTQGRSLAIDRRIFPMGGLAFIRASKPTVDGSGKILDWVECSRFVLNQDTGGAIRGPGRADLFWGHGQYAEIAAGHMQHDGDLYLLVLKPDAR